MHVKITPGGKIVTSRAVLAAGQLQITDTCQALWVHDELHDTDPDAYVLTLRETWLDGQPVLDPERAKALAAQAGLADPPQQAGS